MGYHLPHELVLIGSGKRIDSVQPGKNSVPGICEERRSVASEVARCTSLSPSGGGRTARPNGNR